LTFLAAFLLLQHSSRVSLNLWRHQSTSLLPYAFSKPVPAEPATGECILPSSKNGIWLEGFRAGQALKHQLPYSAGTPEAKAWLEGWAQGIHVNGHSPFMAEKVDFSGRGVQSNKVGILAPSRWRRLLEILFGR
jgi:hypothetical protein